jgi:PAS domain S-box-containing protein
MDIKDLVQLEDLPIPITVVPKNVYIISESDLQGNITYANDEFIGISGYTREELIGSPHSIIRSEYMPDDVFREIWVTIKQGRTYRGLILNKRKDGVHYVVYVRIAPIYKHNAIVGYKSIRQYAEPYEIKELILKLTEGKLNNNN